MIGSAISTLVARAPWLWPLIRRPTQRFWDRMAAAWGGRTTTPGRMRPLEAAIDRVGTPRRILEIGTGAGEGSAIIAERFPGADVTAVDYSQNMLDIARKAVPERVRLKLADAASLPFEDGAFDLVAQMNVPVYFSEVARVTAPGGCVVVASSLGPMTPYYTPHSVLRRKLARRGLREVAAEQSPPGDFFIACRPS